ncbi:MAG: YaiI/YqxD family protein [Gemmatimonadales bacterium]|nr:MAG: YaiI/YqxD family protein [Gemmatimonadales bacterium]
MTTTPDTSPSFRLWVDADAAPRDVKEIVFRAAARLGLETILVANHRVPLPLNNPHVRAILVSGGADVADQRIVDDADPADVAVTADIPLAALLVEKGLVVLDPRGEEYSPSNIGERLSIRDFMDSLRTSGVETGGPSAYGEREKRAFANALDRTLTARMRGR